MKRIISIILLILGILLLASCLPTQPETSVFYIDLVDCKVQSSGKVTLPLKSENLPEDAKITWNSQGNQGTITQTNSEYSVDFTAPAVFQTTTVTITARAEWKGGSKTAIKECAILAIPTVTPLPSATASPTFIPSPSYTVTFTPSPPATETNTPTPTTTASSTPTATLPPGTFIKGCLPSSWVLENHENNGNCVDLTGYGVTVEEYGLTLYEKPENQLKNFLLKLPLDSRITEIEFKVRLNAMRYSKESIDRYPPTTIFFGIGNGSSPYKGYYLMFDRYPEMGNDINYSSYLLNAVPKLNLKRYMYTAFHDGDFMKIEFRIDAPNFNILREENQDYSRDYKVLRLDEISAPYFMIGYEVAPVGGTLDVEIYDFHIVYR